MADINLLDTNITYLKGVGPRKAELLASELNIVTYIDLIQHYPFRYVDKSQIYELAQLKSTDISYQVKVKVDSIEEIGVGKAKRLKAILYDSSGSIEAVWFKGAKWVKEKLKHNVEYLFYCKPNSFNNKLTFTHPEFEEFNNDDFFGEKLSSVYHSTEKLTAIGLTSKGIQRLQKALLSQVSLVIPENLPDSLIVKYKLISRRDAIKLIHFPPTLEHLEKAKNRMKYEELFYLQLMLLRNKTLNRIKSTGHIFKHVGNYFNEFYSKHLPFELTNAQKRVIKEIRIDMGSGKQMNRLLQGDVGSGKTLVALLNMLIAMDNGFQSAFMAPTEILAQQHFNTLQKFLGKMDINVSLLTGSTPKSTRTKMLSELSNGNIQIIIGTHALIEDPVIFNNLGFVVIDEQHRFGVEQRAKLWRKSTLPPHILVMTATPIPRTMAMTIYGDLDYSVIDELPAGRKPIQTFLHNESYRLRVFAFMKKLIAEGRQVYVVYPIIEESETLDLNNLMEGYESISREFKLPEYRLGVLHGRMKPAAKDYEMSRFSRGETQILVSTTVIEVGVDVPNATLMVIENSERFGLSQLHQLRGRVGRGGNQSYCILMTSNKISKEAKERLEIMVKTNDGFEIAEADLKFRGPGDMQGTKQSGVLELKISDLVMDEKILRFARHDANEIISSDPNFEELDNKPIKEFYQQYRRSKTEWSRIS